MRPIRSCPALWQRAKGPHGNCIHNEHDKQQTKRRPNEHEIRGVFFGGYRWWKNKFGIEPNQPNGYFVGTTESTWLAGTAMKF